MNQILAYIFSRAHWGGSGPPIKDNYFFDWYLSPLPRHHIYGGSHYSLTRNLARNTTRDTTIIISFAPIKCNN